MPANSRQPAPQASAQIPALPKNTAKYTNKDGTKYIEVPKSSASTPPAQPSPTTTASSRGGTSVAQPPNNSSEIQPAPHVNPKKQKRRAKAAAKAAAKQAQEATANGFPSPASTASVPPPHPKAPLRNAHHSHHDHQPRAQQESANHAHESGDWGEETESDDDDQGRANGSASNSKKSRKKKKKGTGSQSGQTRPSGMSKEKIWNTSGPEERERIKQFWLGLKEDERKSLVKVEKDTVLKKMKEQQKHTCSCSVCGRKRTAIEEELEGLYDAYYEELESFANQPHNHPDGPSMFGGPKRFGPMTGLHPPGSVPSRYSNHHPSRGRIVEDVDNDDEDDEEEDDGEGYSEEDDLDDDEDDEDEPEEMPRDSLQQDFFTFGQSLTVKGMHTAYHTGPFSIYLPVFWDR